jgi:hypothetical protein
MNYTKGEWRAYFGHDGQFKGEPLITAPRENGLPHTIVARLIDGTIPELEANANLISAAPDMYQVLELALSELDSIDALCKLADTTPYTTLRRYITKVLLKANGKDG